MSAAGRQAAEVALDESRRAVDLVARIACLAAGVEAVARRGSMSQIHALVEHVDGVAARSLEGRADALTRALRAVLALPEPREAASVLAGGLRGAR